MYYPTSDDLLGSLGLSRVHARSSVPDWVTPVTVFGAGLIVGAAGALLLAPKPGRELREDLRIAANNAGEAVRHAGEQVREKLPNVSVPNFTARQDAIEAK